VVKRRLAAEFEHGVFPTIRIARNWYPVLEKNVGASRLFKSEAIADAVLWPLGSHRLKADQLKASAGSLSLSPGKISDFKERFVSGCLFKGYSLEFA